MVSRLKKDKGLKMVKVWCEWDMGFSNITDNYSVFETREDAIKALEGADWESVDYKNWQEVEEDGLLSIDEL